MNKRGLDQVDWAISLGIFLLYIAWFFIFIKPQIQEVSDLTPLANIIKDNLKQETYYEIEEYPLFVKSGKTENATAVFLNISKTDGESLSGDTDYYTYRNRTLILADFQNDTKHYKLLKSNKNYTHENKRLDIETLDNQTTTSKGLSAEFSKGLPIKLSYNNNEYVENITFKINNFELNPSQTNYTNYGIVAEYFSKTQPLHVYSRIIAKNSIVWISTEEKDLDNEETLTLSFQISGFQEYYTNNKHHGNITGCTEYEADYLKIYNNYDSLSLIMPEDSTIRFCKESGDINLNLTINAENYQDLFIIFDDKDYEKESFYNYTTMLGVKRVYEGIDETLLAGLDYATKKSEWGIPYENNFQIIIWNQTIASMENKTTPLLTLGEDYTTSNQNYVAEYKDYILGSDGKTTEVMVNIKTW